MSFCDFVPTDPSCAPAPEPTPVEPTPVEPTPVEPTPQPTPDQEETTDPVEKEEKETTDAPMEPKKEAGEEKESESTMMMMGNLAFLGVAAGHVAGISLDLFRYKSDADYYLLGKSYANAADKTNWWQISNQISMYGGLAISSILMITQLLSMFGIAVSTNVMLWGYSSMFVMPLVAMAAGALKFYAYDLYYQDSIDTTSNTTGTSTTQMAVLESECMMEAIMELSATATLAMNYESWQWAQYLAADEATQAEWREGAAKEMMAEEAMKKELYGEMMMKGDKKMDRDMDKMEKKDDDKMDAEMKAEADADATAEAAEFAL